MKINKENFWEQVRIRVTSSIVVTTITSIFSILIIVLISIYDPFTKILQKYISFSILIVLLLVLFVALILSLIYIIYLKKKLKPSLIKSLGVYWDEELNPYCPSCKTLLSNYAYYGNGSKHHPGMKCIACDKLIQFSDESKIFYELGEARSIVQGIIKKNQTL